MVCGHASRLADFDYLSRSLVFGRSIAGLGLLALGAAGTLNPVGKGPTIAYAVGNCVSTLFFLFLFVGVYGDKWTKLWYPQIFINAAFGYLGGE